MDEQNNQFHYTYSAPTEEERREIESIKREYQPREKNDLEQLRALNRKVQNPPVIVALTLGIIGVLIFGLGLTMILEWAIFLFGVIVCIIGAVVAAPAYFVYRHMLKRRKKKYGQKILNLCNALSNESEQKE